jgi:dienelactone hydrolase
MFATTALKATLRHPCSLACAALATWLGASPAATAGPEPIAPGLHGDVVFSEYSPLAGNAELIRRLLSPLAAWQTREAIARNGAQMREQPINLAQEHFVLYVPAHAGPRGHGLLVFVAPWREAALPRGWDSVLERYDLVFVSAANSGNDANLLGRRDPLALLGATNVMQRLNIDPERVYVSGFSGGSRIALRLALGYPDVFRGALLMAGSDPVGTNTEVLPPADLLRTFQERTHVVYLTGEQDKLHIDMDRVSLASLRSWCVNALDDDITPGAGHEVADPRALARGLETLRTTPPVNAARLAACRAGIEAELARSLERLEAVINSGARADAHKQLLELDAHFGGIAAPRTIELARKCECTLSP